MKLQEVVLCASAPSSPGTGSGSILLHDIQTGILLASFKQTSAPSHCTAIVETKEPSGGILFSSQLDKPILNVYSFQKDQISLKVVLPEKLACIAVDNQGTYFAGATAQGRIYIWEVASGIMYNSWDAHYRQINVLKFTRDGAALLSGSEDSGVAVWSVSRLLNDDAQNELPLPYCTLSDHTLPVTDIICGIGNFPLCRVLTSSMDHSVKIWDLSSKSLLTTFQYPQSITTLAWDQTERLFFAASPDGSIHQTNLFRQREGKDGMRSLEAVGGEGMSDIIRMDEAVREAQKRRLISIEAQVTSMAISLTSTLLLVGTVTGLIHIIDIPTHQRLRTITAYKGFSITYLQAILKPPDLVGHVDLSLYTGHGTDSKENIPVTPITAFQRMRDAKARETHDVSLILPITDQPLTKPVHYPMDELLQDQSFFVQPRSAAEGSHNNTAIINARVAELENEVEHLKAQLGKAKSINDAMWDNVVQQVVMNGKVSLTMEDADDEGESGRRRKRGRT